MPSFDRLVGGALVMRRRGPTGLPLISGDHSTVYWLSSRGYRTTQCPQYSSRYMHCSIEEFVTVGVVHEGVTLDPCSSVTLKLQAMNPVMTLDPGRGRSYTEWRRVTVVMGLWYPHPAPYNPSHWRAASTSSQAASSCAIQPVIGEHV